MPAVPFDCCATLGAGRDIPWPVTSRGQIGRDTESGLDRDSLLDLSPCWPGKSAGEPVSACAWPTCPLVGQPDGLQESQGASREVWPFPSLFKSPDRLGKWVAGHPAGQEALTWASFSLQSVGARYTLALLQALTRMSKTVSGRKSASTRMGFAQLEAAPWCWCSHCGSMESLPRLPANGNRVSPGGVTELSQNCPLG